MNRTKNIGEGVPANHGARVVDITTCFQPLDNDEASKKQKAAAVAGSRGKSAQPMSAPERLGHYAKQTGSVTLTPAQARRWMKKMNAQPVPVMTFTVDPADHLAERPKGYQGKRRRPSLLRRMLRAVTR